MAEADHLFELIAECFLAHGARRICDLPGCWERTIPVARARGHAPSNVGPGVSGHKPGPLSRRPTQLFRPRIPGRRAGEKGERSIGADLPRIAAPMASAVTGASRMPFRVWPVA